MRTRAEIVNPCIGFLYSPYPGPSVDLRKNRTPDIKPFEKPDPKYRTSIRKSRPDSFFFETNNFTTEDTLYFTTQSGNILGESIT